MVCDKIFKKIITLRFSNILGVFVDYNYLDTPDEPKTSGFSAGVWYNGAQSWVGMGSDSTCSGMSNMPGRISIPPDNPGKFSIFYFKILLNFFQVLTFHAIHSLLTRILRNTFKIIHHLNGFQFLHQE